jgi:hypothetical protein
MRRSEGKPGPARRQQRLFVSILHTLSGGGMHRMKALGFGESLDIKGARAKNRGPAEAVSKLNLAPHARFEALYVKCGK